MGKRSDFKRIERDFYPTPLAAVEPLIPHLPKGRFDFVEPFAGDGQLIWNIIKLRDDCTCILATDIEPLAEGITRADFRDVDMGNVECTFISNSPWDRKILHPAIEHFSEQGPTWLLFDADWMHTKQSAPYMEYCHKIVSVGRVKWIPDSKMTGKDNCAWYLFDQSRTCEGTVFIGR